MRIFLANDSSNQMHWGCSATANGLRRFLNRHAIEVAYATGVREIDASAHEDAAAFARSAREASILKSCDLLVVNGEGSIHASRTPELEMLIEAALVLGVPFAVANACIRDYPRMIPLLRQAAFITVRDSRSMTYLAGEGIAATRSADACIYADFQDAGSPPAAGDVAFTDWHPEATGGLQPLIRAAHDGRGAFVPFKRLDAHASWPAALATLAQYGRIVCARYHGAVFSILAGRDVALLHSNTDKIRAFAADYGLDSRLVTHPDAMFEVCRDDALKQAHDQLRAEAADWSCHPLHPLASRRVSPTRPPLSPPPPEASPPGRNTVSKHEVMKARRAADRFASRSAHGAADAELHRGAGDTVVDGLPPLSGFGLRVFAALVAQESRPAGCDAAAREFERAGEIDLAFSLYAAANRMVPNRYALHQAALWGHSDLPVVALSTLRGDAADEDRAHQRSLAEQAEAAGLMNLAVRTRMDLFRLTRSVADLRVAARLAHNHGLIGAAGEIVRLCDDRQVKPEDLAPYIGQLFYMLGERMAGLDLLSRHRTARRCGQAVDRPTPAAPELLADRLAGRRIGLACESEAGIGNAVWALGFAAMLASHVKGIEVAVDPRMHGLIRRCLGPAGIDPVESFSGDVEMILDRHEVMMACFALAPQPRVPAFLSADAGLTQHLRARYQARLGHRPLVGIAWFTSNPHSGWRRSVELAATIRGIDPAGRFGFVALQYGEQRVDADIATAPSPARVFRDPELDIVADIDGHFAQIAAMDAVVTIDASVVHFAGALGKPTAVLTSRTPIWKWYAAEEAGVLSPGQVLFHQARCGSWRVAHQEVATWLDHICAPVADDGAASRASPGQ